MDKAKRKAIIAGNWKMNKTASEAAVLVDELVPAVQDAGCEVVICTPYTDLVTAVEKTKGTNIHVGAENVHFEKSGAFTGEISADMLVDLGVEYVIVGHSEDVYKRQSGNRCLACVEGAQLEQLIVHFDDIVADDHLTLRAAGNNTHNTGSLFQGCSIHLGGVCQSEAQAGGAVLDLSLIHL